MSVMSSNPKVGFEPLPHLTHLLAFFRAMRGGISLKRAADTPRNTPSTHWLSAEAPGSERTKYQLLCVSRELARWMLADVLGSPWTSALSGAQVTFHSGHMVTHDPELARRAHRNVHVMDGQVTDLQPFAAKPLVRPEALAAG